MADRDYYRILGLPRGASQDEIRKAYLKRVRELHPDTSHEGATHERFVELQQAYACLSDQDNRRSYDSRLARPHPGAAAGWPLRRTSGVRRPEMSLQDFILNEPWESLAAIFSGMGFERLAHARRRSQPQLALEVKVTAEEARNGARTWLSLPIPESCLECGGSGADLVNYCAGCRGRGYVETRRSLPIELPAFQGRSAIFRLTVGDSRLRDLELVVRAVVG